MDQVEVRSLRLLLLLLLPLMASMALVVILMAPACAAGGLNDINKEVTERLKGLPRDGRVNVTIATHGHVCQLSVNRTRGLDLYGQFQCPEWTTTIGKGSSYSIIDMIGKTLRDFLNRAKVNGDIDDQQVPQWFSSLSLSTGFDVITSGSESGSAR